MEQQQVTSCSGIRDSPQTKLTHTTQQHRQVQESGRTLEAEEMNLQTQASFVSLTMFVNRSLKPAKMVDPVLEAVKSTTVYVLTAISADNANISIIALRILALTMQAALPIIISMISRVIVRQTLQGNDASQG